MVQELSAMIQQAAGANKEIRIADRPNIRSDVPSTAAGSEPNASQFNEIMTKPVQATTPSAPLPAPMQEAARVGGILKVQEAKQLSAVFDRFKQNQERSWKEIGQKIKQNPNLELSPSLSSHLDMKLGTINRQLGAIQYQPGSSSQGNEKFVESLGVATDELSKPIKTFFNFIANGERQLYGLQAELDSVFSKGTELVNPAVMLKLQLKMTHVSQQLELFTSILNKGLESSKTVFNTQI
jgi:hypothetical protein